MSSARPLFEPRWLAVSLDEARRAAAAEAAKASSELASQREHSKRMYAHLSQLEAELAAQTARVHRLEAEAVSASRGSNLMRSLQPVAVSCSCAM